MAGFELGFLIFLNYAERSGALQSLEDGLTLFERAEQLGFDSGWVRVHHGAKTLSAPFPFLTAAALRTSHIKLGTAVIPVGYEDPLRFAEDAATTDLLSSGRLELALSAGIPSGSEPANRDELVGERVRAIQAAIRGSGIESADSPAAGTPLPHGPVSHPDEVRAHPFSPGLDTRLWYGAGGLSSALRAARLGLNLVLSTIGTHDGGKTLGHSQADVINRYREAFSQAHPELTPRVAIARSILPIVDEADEARYGGFRKFYDDLVTPEGAYRNDPAFTGQASPLYSGPPDSIIEALSADPSLALADTLLLTPLSELGTAQKLDLFESVTTHVAPGLGWTRSV